MMTTTPLRLLRQLAQLEQVTHHRLHINFPDRLVVRKIAQVYALPAVLYDVATLRQTLPSCRSRCTRERACCSAFFIL